MTISGIVGVHIVLLNILFYRAEHKGGGGNALTWN